jgi:hypothetical protein
LVLGSPIVLNALAAGVASVVAALLSKNLKDARPNDDRTRTKGIKLDGLESEPAERSSVRRAGQKAAVAADTISKAAKKTVSKTAKKAVVNTAKAAVAKNAKAAVTIVQRLSKAAAAGDETAGYSTNKPRRKTRSDVGIKRGSRKVRAQSASPVVLEVTALGDTKTSPVALRSATAVIPQVPQGSSDEQATEAHPS